MCRCPSCARSPTYEPYDFYDAARMGNKALDLMSVLRWTSFRVRDAFYVLVRARTVSVLHPDETRYRRYVVRDRNNRVNGFSAFD